jgi:hypothetical protein
MVPYLELFYQSCAFFFFVKVLLGFISTTARMTYARLVLQMQCSKRCCQLLIARSVRKFPLCRKCGQFQLSTALVVVRSASKQRLHKLNVILQRTSLKINNKINKQHSIC